MITKESKEFHFNVKPVENTVTSVRMVCYGFNRWVELGTHSWKHNTKVSYRYKKHMDDSAVNIYGNLKLAK